MWVRPTKLQSIRLCVCLCCSCSSILLQKNGGPFQPHSFLMHDSIIGVVAPLLCKNMSIHVWWDDDQRWHFTYTIFLLQMSKDQKTQQFQSAMYASHSPAQWHETIQTIRNAKSSRNGGILCSLMLPPRILFSSLLWMLFAIIGFH